MMNLGAAQQQRKRKRTPEAPVSGGRIGRRGERPHFNHPYRIRQDGRYGAFYKEEGP
jgi:hypothetical protein